MKKQTLLRLNWVFHCIVLLMNKNKKKNRQFLLLFRRFFSCSFFLFSGFARNHFMTWVNGHSHADQWTECKIFMCWFHILIAGVASSDHGNQRTDGPVFMWFHLNLLSFFISYIFLRNMQTWIEISYIPRDLIIIIFYYQISLKPLKTLSLSQVSFPLLFPLYYIVPPVFTNSDKGKYKGKKIL